MKKIALAIRLFILAILAFIVSLPKKYVDNAVRANLFGGPRRVTAAMSKPTRGNQVCDAEITVTDGGSGSFGCAVQLLGPNDADLTVKGVVQYFLSSDAAGNTLAVDSTDTSDIVAGTDGTVIAETRSDVAGIVESESNGDIDLTVTVIINKTAYLNIVLPDGTIVTSDAMAYA